MAEKVSRISPLSPMACAAFMVTSWYFPIVLLVMSNFFMTYAWYGHLKDFKTSPLLMVILISWGIAFFEYVLQVPANRLGHQHFSLAQLKVMQEVITMSVFALFAVFYMREPLRWDFLWAGLCLVAAAYFMFRGVGTPTGQ